MVQAINNGDDGEWASEALSLILFVHLTMAEDADKRLASAGLNRTHHRILFLVDHKSGVTVGEIVNLLRLSAQAIQPPLRTLIDNQLISSSRPSEIDESGI